MYTRIPPTLLLGLLATVVGMGAEPEPGLLVRLYDIGEEVRFLPELSAGQLPNAVKVVPTLDLNTERKDFDGLENNFLTEVIGQLNIAQAGKYTLRLISDDGAKLWLDAWPLIDNDGAHAATPKDGEVELQPGQHELRIWHFQAGGGGQLTLQWRNSGAADAGFELIRAALLSHAADASKDTAPGKKKIVPPLRRGRPGDGTPVAGVHPSFERLELAEPSAPQTAALRAALNVRVCADPNGCQFKSIYTRNPLDGAYVQLHKGPGTVLDGEPVAWLPPNAGSDWPSVPCVAGGGPYRGQLFVGDFGSGEMKRVFYEQVGRYMQGCVFRFSGANGPYTVALSSGDDGSILVLSSPTPKEVESHTSSVLRPNQHVTFELRAVRALRDGLELEFTKPLDARVGWDPQAYLVEQWPFRGPDGLHRPVRDGSSIPVESASVSADRRRVFLKIDGLQRARVTYVRLLPPCLSEDGELPWTTEAWYTLQEIPQDRAGEVLPPPAQEPQNFLTAEEKQAGWRLLFDGETTKGWHTYRKQETPSPALPLGGGGSGALRGWKISDGCLVRAGSGGDIATDEDFGDFELSIEWRISPGGNSGIMYHVTEDHNNPWETGPEYQILDNAEHADGQNPLTAAASCYGLYAPPKDVTQPIGLFNKTRILVQKNHVEHWLNGVKVVEYELYSPQWEKLVKESKFGQMPDYGRRTKGKVDLQDHGDKVWYRNIKLRMASGE